MHSRTSVTLAMVLAAAWLAGCSSGASDAPSDSTQPAAEAGAGDADGSEPTEGGSEAGDAGDAGDAHDGGADADAPFEAGPCSVATDPDSDGDRIPDSIEGRAATPATSVDTDGDGTPDYLDLDSDGDGIPDRVEGDTVDVGCYSPLDSDGDGAYDFQDTDSDDNGIPDALEVYPDGSPYDPNHASPNPANSGGGAQPDYCDPDNDGDALADTVEMAPGTPLFACAPKSPPDTDCDGLPDLDDPDSDDDGIADTYEGAVDFDHDGKPNYRDEDSDDDGILDSCEAGPNASLLHPPADSDHDGKYDEVDLDSDGDGLLDNEEDANQNCVVDPGETSPRLYDSDGDGVSDLIESALVPPPADCAITPGCLACANNPYCTPDTKGQFYFILPYQQLAQPRYRLLPVATALQRADIGFVVQTTGNMGPGILALQSSMANIVASLRSAVPDLHVAVAAHDDFPIVPYSAITDSPFRLTQPGAYLSADAGAIATSIGNLIPAHTGMDAPEDQVAALWHALTNQPLYWPNGNGDSIPTDFNTPAGTFGALGFRPDALPVLVSVSDVPFHNGRRATGAGTYGPIHDAYSFNCDPLNPGACALPAPPPVADDLVSAMLSSGARFVGLALDNGVRSGSTSPYQDMAYLADATGSTVPKDAFGGPPYQCPTGLSGSAMNVPTGPNDTCRLVFDLSTTQPDIGQGVVAGITALTSSLTLDIRVLTIPDTNQPRCGDAMCFPSEDVATCPQDCTDPSAPKDPVEAFVKSVQVVEFPGQYGFVDPTDPTVACVDVPIDTSQPTHAEDNWVGAKGLTQGQDTLLDTVTAVTPPRKICFKIDVQDNFMIPQTAKVQVFHAVLQVRAKNGQSASEIDFGPPRDILFVIPPSPQ